MLIYNADLAMDQAQTNDDKRGEILDGLYETVGKFRRKQREYITYFVALDSLSVVALSGAAYGYTREKWGLYTDVLAGLGAVSLIGAQAEFYLFRKHQARADQALHWIRKIESESTDS